MKALLEVCRRVWTPEFMAKVKADNERRDHESAELWTRLLAGLKK